MNQEDTIHRLSMGEGFGNIPPERIDTHISTIFLIGDHAYKLKRAVATSYLNYSGLENRRRFCQAELDINRRTAPRIYLDLVPVRITHDDELILGDEPGKIVDWLVRMRRFSQDALFDSIADEGGLTPSVMTDLADEIAAFHKKAAVTADRDASQRIEAVIDENEGELSNYTGETVNPSTAKLFIQQCRALFLKQSSRMDRRGADGFVRHCHGDLHLRNICLIEGQPTLFDAIEFSDDISHVDVLFDLAFLLMDLEHRGLRSQANLLFNRYLYRTKDIDSLALLPLYMALRAGIRAHTSAMAAELANDEPFKEKLSRDSESYLQLGCRLLEPQASSLVALGGRSGVGKSTIAVEIAPFVGCAPGALIVSSDLIRKRQLGVEPLTKLDESAYSKETDELVYAEILDMAARVLSDGHSVILDATFQDPAKRQDADSLGHLPGVRFNALWLEANAAELNRRVDGRKNDPSDATSSVLARQLAHDVGDITWRRVDADRPVDLIAQSVRDIVTQNPPRAREKAPCHEPYEHTT